MKVSQGETPTSKMRESVSSLVVLVKFRKKEGYKNNLLKSELLKEFKNITKRS